MKSLTDKALLKAADEQFAFRILYERYWESLYIKPDGPRNFAVRFESKEPGLVENSRQAR
jgi:hypothetical protein